MQDNHAKLNLTKVKIYHSCKMFPSHLLPCSIETNFQTGNTTRQKRTGIVELHCESNEMALKLSYKKNHSVVGRRICRLVFTMHRRIIYPLFVDLHSGQDFSIFYFRKFVEYVDVSDRHSHSHVYMRLWIRVGILI